MLYIDQEGYLDRVLTRFGIPNGSSKPKVILLSSYRDLQPAIDKDTRINVAEYQQVIGSVMFAMVYTRPDICFVVRQLSQFISDLAEHHRKALKSLLRYLRSTVKQKMRFRPGGTSQKLVVYTDAD
jgi:hypothetical protein